MTFPPTVKDIILSNSITGAMWKSNTKYLKIQKIIFCWYCWSAYLIIIRCVCWLLDWGPLLCIPHLPYMCDIENNQGHDEPHLHTHHGVHVEPGQLPGLYHSYTYLIVLCLQVLLQAGGWFWPARKIVLCCIIWELLATWEEDSKTAFSLKY